MSDKNNLKDKIKKPNATQAFFNAYDTDDNEGNTNNKDDNKKVIENNNKINDNTDNITKNNKDGINDIEDKTYVNNDNVDVDVDVDDEDDSYLRNLASGKKASKKKLKKVFTSFYMDPDLASEVDKIAARGEKGDKSKLINMAIRKLLEGYGVIEKK
ncbi:ribbon-helix-helix domain-containing protein [Halalkalibacter lacteus]|uniref:ribbon-helix-helix domain-containing protein n=1 Tax=Halalkalibacter lacteus TaxID=3090663 RepID=UPI002FC8D254